MDNVFKEKSLSIIDTFFNYGDAFDFVERATSAVPEDLTITEVSIVYFNGAYRAGVVMQTIQPDLFTFNDNEYELSDDEWEEIVRESRNPEGRV